MRKCRFGQTVRGIESTVLAIVLVSASACSESPTAPRPPALLPARTLSLPAGMYQLDLIGFGISTDPQFPPCDLPLLRGGRTAAWTTVSLTVGQNEWVARAAAPETLEMRFRQVGDSIRGFEIAGWILGTAADAWAPLSPSERGSVLVGGPGNSAAAVVEGVADRFTPFLTGSVAGDIRFTNNDSSSVSNCTVVMWLLQPFVAPE